MSSKIFDGIKYYTINIKDEIINKLDEAGGRHVNYLTGLVTHVISENKDDPEVEEARDIYEICVVNSEWVLLSLYCQKLLPVEPFSLGQQQLFSGVVAYVQFDKEESLNDIDVLWAQLSYYGANILKCFNSSITHVISTNPDIDLATLSLQGEESSTPAEFGHINIVTPDWVDDSLKNKQMVDPKNYNPIYLRKPVKATPITPPPGPEYAPRYRHVQPTETPERRSYANRRGAFRRKDSWPKWRPRLIAPEIKRCPRISLYHGYVPKVVVPPEICLVSCVFHIDEYPTIMPVSQIESWKKVIKLLGGETEPTYTPRCTHLISSTRSDLFKKALSQNVRCVSAHWLNDCVALKVMAPPWKPLHVPVYFSNHPGEKEVVSITNFLGEERTQVKQLLWRIGAKYTGNLNQSNTLLISRNNAGPKVKKAREWGIATVNLRWLLDCVYQNDADSKLPCTKDPKYTDMEYTVPTKSSNNLLQYFGPNLRPTLAENTNNETFLLDHSINADILEPWKTGLPLEQGEVDKRSVELKIFVDTSQSNNPQPAKNLTIAETPNPENGDGGNAPGTNFAYQPHLLPQQKKRLIEAANAVAKKMASLLTTDSSGLALHEKNASNALNNTSPPVTLGTSHNISASGISNGPTEKSYVVMITGVPKSNSYALEKKVQDIKGSLTDNPLVCSHLVMDRVKRTIKFFCAFSHCRYVLNSQWILDSHKAGHFLAEDEYILHDKEAEKTFNFCLKTSLYRAQHRDPLFQNTNFYLTPKVEPPPSILKPIIESAGGTIIKQRPSARQVNLQNKDNNRCIIISCTDDLSLCKDYLNQNINVYNVELILTGLLQQNLNFEQFKVQPAKEIEL